MLTILEETRISWAFSPRGLICGDAMIASAILLEAVKQHDDRCEHESQI